MAATAITNTVLKFNESGAVPATAAVAANEGALITCDKQDQKMLIIVENGITYVVDFENGQKTGYFLDQKYNRLETAKLAAGKRVLDCFTHTGSFALNAAKAGAAHVTAVDVSQTAIDAAKRNAEHNGLLTRMDFICEDVFDLLQRLEQSKQNPYELIILDPRPLPKAARP
jgi:23S rRNA (cytosine1962-C5)-methyltransferase